MSHPGHRRRVLDVSEPASAKPLVAANDGE